MNPNVFIPGRNPELPKSYNITIYYIDGTREEHEVASHVFMETVTEFNMNGSTKSKSFMGIFEFVTVNDEWHNVPLSNVRRIHYDKNFSKVVAVRKKEAEAQKAIN